MKTIRINIDRPEREKIQRIAGALKEGKTIVIPTDTTYGLAANALNKKAIKKVFAIKKRAKNKPLSVLVRDLKMAERIAYLDSRAKRIFKKFLPGPLTIVVKKIERRLKPAATRKCKILPDILTAGQPNVGIRLSGDKVTRAIMQRIDFPITATSANLSGKKVPYSVEEILKQYKNQKLKPDLIVDAGKLPKVRPSTVVDLSRGKIKILRKGTITCTNF